MDLRGDGTNPFIVIKSLFNTKRVVTSHLIIHFVSPKCSCPEPP